MNASINDISHETGVQKGGIYRHFAQKDALIFAFQLIQCSIFFRKC
ncbi:helix-turn-helix transcriptional regulator [Brevibacterium sp. JNUCC-42]|nr:helix-turn-helix transcriptional regulator [Brevibacterium sp. JNUCC-42]